MFSPADKTVKPSVKVQQKTGSTFFGSQKESKTDVANPSFFQPAIQPKLTVNQPNDPYEKEADLVAERVMNIPEHNVGLATTTPPEVQRQEDVKEEEEESLQMASMSLQRMADGDREEEETVQMKAFSTLQRNNSETELVAEKEQETLQRYTNRRPLGLHHSDVIQLSGRGPPATGAQFQSKLHQSTSGGQPMHKAVGNDMSSRFGADFSNVRIHTDTTAQQMSKDINAHAFTYGNHIYFNSGKYDPHSASGKTLLAHELTHT
ncbi:MAG: DUF4157 domain-containing protein, partial [Bacteroidetes bacterium]|nr:DUF4157 domain-containing protein [Bacteroidota bacterium]